MLEAKFNKDDQIIIIDNVYQYDFGQKLKIIGIDLPEIFEVHFGTFNSDTTITEMGTTQNGISIVNIPDDMFRQTQEVDAYIFVTEDGGGRTVKVVRFKPIRRGKSDTYIEMEDSEFISKVIEQINLLLASSKTLNSNLTSLVNDNLKIQEAFKKIQDTYKKQVAEDPALELLDARNSERTGISYENLGERLNSIETNLYKGLYGVRRKITDNTSPLWERIEGGIGLVANATHNGTDVQNDFDKIYPWSEIITCNYNKNENKIMAYYGEPGFQFDGSNGEVLTKFPEFYWKRYIEDDYEYILISQYHFAGFNKSDEFFIGRYLMSVDEEENAHSFSGVFPVINKNTTQQRNYAKAIGDGFCLTDYRYFLIQMLYLVEYATFNSQTSLGNGLTNMRYNDSDKSLIAEENTNKFVLSESGAKNFIVGQFIRIGSKNASQNDIAKDRKIIRIEDYNNNDTVGKAIYFDGEAVNIAVNNVISSQVQKTGGCDELGMKSGCMSNTGKESIIYRGVEDIFGHMWQKIDGVNLKNKEAYVCYDPKNYESDKFESPYMKISFACPKQEGYIKKEGLDKDNSCIILPDEIGGNSATNICDYCYTNATDNNTVLLVGGSYSSTSAAGLFAVSLTYASSNSSPNIGCRVLKYQ